MQRLTEELHRAITPAARTSILETVLTTPTEQELMLAFQLIPTPIPMEMVMLADLVV